jgi:hypothetical protein
MVINLEASSSRKLKEVSDLIQPIDTFKGLLEATEKITSNPICAKDLGVDKKIAKLDIVSETVAELNKNITEKLDAKGKEF